MTLEVVEGWVRLIGTIGAVVGMIAGWTFVLSYRHDPWHKYPAGVHLMRFTAGLTCILSYVVVYALVAMIVPPNPWLDFVVVCARSSIFCWVAYQLVIRDQLLAEAHRKEKTIVVTEADRNGTTTDLQDDLTG